MTRSADTHCQNFIGQQVTDYLTANPKIPANTLVVVWGGANDVLSITDPSTASAAITTAVTGELTAVQRLITAGATNILVPNLPPLGVVPRLNTNTTLGPLATEAAQVFNAQLAAGLTNLKTAGVTISQLDVYTLFSNAVANPATYAFTNVTQNSQNVAGINPDNYLFWDDLHPTTAGHHQVALAVTPLVAPALATTTTTIASSAPTVNAGSSVTFTATVSASAGSPTGTVTFLDGGTSIGTGTLSSAGTTTTAAFSTTTLAAGTHTITAAYGATAGFMASTSTPITETIVAPTFTAALSASTLTVASGAAGTSTLTVTPMGGYTGSIALTCSGLPALATCAISPASLTFTSSSTAETATVKISTSSTAPASAALLLFPLGGLGMLFALRRRRTNPGLLLLLLVFSGAGLFGFTGCGGGAGKTTTTTPPNTNAAPGTYAVTVTVTPSTGVASTLPLTLVVQ